MNVGKCKLITFSRLRYPVKFPYMLGGIILDRVDYTADLGVVMDNSIPFSRHVDVMVEKASAKLEFLRKYCQVSSGTFYVSLVRPKLEYASCIWRPFNDVKNRIEPCVEKVG
jgi:hypothetical protein